MFPATRLIAPPTACLRSVRGAEALDRRADDIVEAIVSTVLTLSGRRGAAGRVRVAIERPPPTVAGKMRARRGGQTAIGWSMGLLAGVVWARVRPRIQMNLGLTPEIVFIDVSPWRARAAELVLRWGAAGGCPPGRAEVTPRARPPGLELDHHPDGAGYKLTYRPCGHVHPSPVLGTLAELQRHPALRACGTCAAARGREVQPLDGTERWKMLACETTKRFYPDEYAALIADADSRARTDKPDHELEGVHDACEALWTALASADGVEGVAP